MAEVGIEGAVSAIKGDEKRRWRGEIVDLDSELEREEREDV